MGLVDSAALALAESIEGRLGPRAALAAFRPLVQQTSGSARTRAILGALRCAVKLEEGDEVTRLAPAWTSAGTSERFAEIAALCFKLADLGLTTPAAALALAEAERAPRARAHYLAARCLELASDERALDALQIACNRAVIEGDRSIEIAARARRVERLAALPATRASALAEAIATDPSGGSAAERFVVAKARLGSPSPFARGTALSMLEDLARLGADLPAASSVALAAIHLAARHADERADALHPVETERIAATLRHHADEARRDHALARLDAIAAVAKARGGARDDALAAAAEIADDARSHLVRARAVLEGAGQGSFPGVDLAAMSTEARLASFALDAIAAIRRDRSAETMTAIANAEADLGGDVIAPSLLWTAAYVCLTARDARVRDHAARLCEALLGRSGPPPPRGYASLAPALHAADRGDLAARALEAAVAAREPGAEGSLAAELTREGFRLSSRDRNAAIAALKKARSLSMPQKKSP